MLANMEFFDKISVMTIGSRLRMLSDKITEDTNEIYGTEFKAEWFPLLVILADGSFQTIANIAKQTGHSHHSASRIVKEMLAKKLITENKDCIDERKNVVGLSDEGMLVADKLKEQYSDIASAIGNIIAATNSDLLKVIREWEELLAEKSLLERVKDERKERERRNIEIVEYNPSYKEIFKQLNEDWINSHWQMEDLDYKALEHPQEYILDKGGYIFVALYKNEPVGVCALYNMASSNIYDYELAKYAVSPKVQGKGIGFLLCATAIAKAKELGGHKIFLESNTILKPAIHIYKKLGFREIDIIESSPYARADIQMELDLF